MLLTATTIPVPTGALPERLSTARPADADGIRLLTAECAAAGWPDHGDYPPLVLDAARLRMPWHYVHGCTLRLSDGSEYRPAELLDAPAFAARTGETADRAEYDRWQGWYLLVLTGTAAMVDSVTDGGPWSGDEYPMDMWGGSPAVSYRGAPVALDSWTAMRDTDPAALWTWSAADRSAADARRDRRQREAVMEAALPQALRCAQALYDALRLLLPAAAAQPPPAPTNRRSTWR